MDDGTLNIVVQMPENATGVAIYRATLDVEYPWWCPREIALRLPPWLYEYVPRRVVRGHAFVGYVPRDGGDGRRSND